MYSASAAEERLERDSAWILGLWSSMNLGVRIGDEGADVGRLVTVDMI